MNESRWFDVFRYVKIVSSLPKRPRLSGHDYTEPGWYFVTLVTNFRSCILSQVVSFTIELSDLGEVVEDQLGTIPKRFPNLSVDAYVIMPNHVHLLILCENAVNWVSLSRVINELKSRVTLNYNRVSKHQGTVWQLGFYDVVVRSEVHLRAIRQYIERNPIEWELDDFNPNFNCDRSRFENTGQFDI